MEQEQQSYEGTRAHMQTLEGFYVHAGAFLLGNIGLFAINVLAGGVVVLLVAGDLEHRIGDARPGRVRLRRRLVSRQAPETVGGALLRRSYEGPDRRGRVRRASCGEGVDASPPGKPEGWRGDAGPGQLHYLLTDGPGGDLG
jgi:hypothetical protein